MATEQDYIDSVNTLTATTNELLGVYVTAKTTVEAGVSSVNADKAEVAASAVTVAADKAAAAASATAAKASEEMAAQIAGLDTVSEAIGLISPANIDWDVDIPFNEGLEMARGFGNRDAYGNRAVDFSRASAQLYVNKSGKVVEAAVDEPCIQKNGVLVTSDATGLSSHSLDLTQADWAGLTPSTACPSEDVGVLTPVLITPRAVEAIHSGPTQSDEFASTGWYQQTYIIKAKELGVVQFGSNPTLSPIAGYQLCKVDFRDGTIISGSEYITRLEKISNGFWIVSHKFQTSVVMHARRILQIYSNDNEQTWTPNGTDGLLFAYGQLIYCGANEPDYSPPLIKTEAGKSSVAANLPSIPAENNFPTSGEPFFIVMDCAVPMKGEATSRLFRLVGGGSSFYARRTIGSSQIILSLYDGARSTAATVEADGERHRFIAAFTNTSIKLYVDGINKDESVSNIPLENLYGLTTGSLYIGHSGFGVEYLNCEVGPFMVFSGEITDELAIALGGAQ